MKATEKADFFRQTAKQINEIEGNTIKMDLGVKHFSNLTVEELFEIYKLRVSVFVVEQNCPYQEIDDADKVAYHVFLKDEAGIQAYVRVLPQGATFPEASIGRVIAKKRRCGLGSQILVAGIQVAQEKFHATELQIGAQLYAKPFYEAAGFVQASEGYLEDGIPHIHMKWKQSDQEAQ